MTNPPYKKVDIPSEEEWLAYRRNAITSSDVPVIMGVTGSLYHLNQIKRGLSKREEEENEQWNWSLHVEESIVDWTASHCEYLKGFGVDFNKEGYRCYERTEPSLGYPASITPDSTIFVEIPINIVSGIEVKNWNHFSGKMWENDHVPAYVNYQVHHCMMVMGVDWWIVSACIGGQAPAFRMVKRDELTCKQIRQNCYEFWKGVQAGIDYTCDTGSWGKYEIPPQDELEIHTIHQEEENDIRLLYETYKRLERIRSDCSKQYDTIQNEMVDFFYGTEAIKFSDGTGLRINRRKGKKPSFRKLAKVEVKTYES